MSAQGPHLHARMLPNVQSTTTQWTLCGLGVWMDDKVGQCVEYPRDSEGRYIQDGRGAGLAEGDAVNCEKCRRKMLEESLRVLTRVLEGPRCVQCDAQLSPDIVEGRRIVCMACGG